jgi:hypothetical protein
MMTTRDTTGARQSSVGNRKWYAVQEPASARPSRLLDGDAEYQRGHRLEGALA